MDLDLVTTVVEGRGDVDSARKVVDLMVASYPIRLADLWIEPDDTDEGVRIMRAEESAATSRVFERKTAKGTLEPFYEYRDTAMSRLGPFKPEWIAPLRVVENADADNPEVAYNKGHLMHQTTFFIGDVNFYWKQGDETRCAELSTGDSNYITPFVPHSFTSRDPERPGLIIAVTYAGPFRGALQDAYRAGTSLSDDWCGDQRDAIDAFGALMKRHLANEMMSVAQVATALREFGIADARAEAVALGQALPDAQEVAALMKILSIRQEDLAVTPIEPGQDVVVRMFDETEERVWPEGNEVAYRMRPMARSPQQPNLKGFVMDICKPNDPGPAANLEHMLHEYVYNWSERPVAIYWGDARESILKPGDSAYIAPFVKHRFGLCDEGSGRASIITVRVPGALTEFALQDFACFDTRGRDRAQGENTQWF
ncbi:MAG: hypothetical protein JJ900_13245 [Rhodospirillales bacterium]|nr:hypothetical protein [Rhodospirillales bacterium]